MQTRLPASVAETRDVIEHIDRLTKHGKNYDCTQWQNMPNRLSKADAHKKEGRKSKREVQCILGQAGTVHNNQLDRLYKRCFHVA